MFIKTLSVAVAGILALGVLATSATAQPILDRVEKLLRGQVDAAQAAPAASEPGYLGLVGDETPEPGQGVRVLQVFAGQGAAAAGLRVGDVITKIDGTPIRAMNDMGRVVEGKPPGTKLALTVTRAGAEQQIELTLGRRPGAAPPGNEELPAPGQPAAAPPERQRLGVRTVPVSETVRRLNSLPTAAGAQVVSVTVGSPAERAQIPLGAVVTAVDAAPVNSPNALAAAIAAAAGPEVELSYVHRGQPQRRKITLAAAQVADKPQQRELRARPAIVDPPGPSDDPPPADNPPSAADDRIATLEARVQELEARVKTLEAELAKEKPDAPQE